MAGFKSARKKTHFESQKKRGILQLLRPAFEAQKGQCGLALMCWNSPHFEVKKKSVWPCLKSARIRPILKLKKSVRPCLKSARIRPIWKLKNVSMAAAAVVLARTLRIGKFSAHLGLISVTCHWIHQRYGRRGRPLH